MKYSEKLRDPRWQKKRLKIFERDGFTCCRCGDSNEELQVHHLKYTSNPWDESDINLITLCKTCHEFESKFMATIKPNLKSTKYRMIGTEKQLVLFFDNCVIIYYNQHLNVMTNDTINFLIQHYHNG